MAINYNPRLVTDGLVLCLDAANPKSYVGSGTTWTDLSGRGNNGTLVNGVGYVGTNGGALSFDGVDDYVYRSTFTSPPTNIVSIVCWVKFSNNVNNRYLLSFGRDVGGGIGGLALIAYGGFVGNQIIFELGSGAGRVSSGISPSLNTWYCITTTADGTNTRFYLNAVLKNTSAQGSGAIAYSPGLSVGSYLSAGIPPTPGVYFHSGNISQVSIYNRALSAAEISQNFLAMRARFGI